MHEPFLKDHYNMKRRHNPCYNIEKLLTNASRSIVSQSVTRQTATLDSQITQVITNLFTAAIIQLTKICERA